MTSAGTQKNGDEARLWLVALLISVVLNGLLLAWVTLEIISSEITKEMAIPTVTEESIVTIFPDMFEVESEEKNLELEKSQSVRTSDDQISPEAPKSRRFIGERNTQATSDREATNDDKSMPSQVGREARPEEEPETTVSKYQDGRLDSPNQAALPNQAAPISNELPDPLFQPSKAIKGETQPDPGEAEVFETAIRDKLLDGPNVVEKEVSKAEAREDIKPRDEKKTRNGDLQGVALNKPVEDPKPATKPSPATVKDPAFQGNQSKTAILGSISRTGRSALNVVDTPMGRYHALISRAVELEWQRNCVRRRDFIVPGYLTARFFLNEKGKVTSVNLVGEIEGGEIQKGFTLDSIREADIPAMPADVIKEMEGDSLELLFNFYF